MKPQDAKALAKTVRIIMGRLDRQDNAIQRLLELRGKDRESIELLFKELNTKASILDEFVEKVRELFPMTESIMEEIKHINDDLKGLEEEFFTTEIIEESLQGVDSKMAEAEPVAKPTPYTKRVRVKTALTRDDVMDMLWKKLKYIAINLLGCPEPMKDTNWYRNYILDHPDFKAGKVLI